MHEWELFITQRLSIILRLCNLNNEAEYIEEIDESIRYGLNLNHDYKYKS